MPCIFAAMFDFQRAVVWLNGQLLLAREAQLSPFDQGLTMGLGVFETLVAYEGKVFAFSRHWERLGQGCAALSLSLPDRREVEQALRDVMAANELPHARLRITITPGPGWPGAAMEAAGAGTVLVTAVPRPALAPRARVALLSEYPRSERSPLAGLKSTSYAENVVALAEARRRGADEGLLPNVRGEVCEGSASNVFLARGGVLITPPLASGCLAGVTRALVLELARQEIVPVEETPVPWDVLLEAEEAFLTSSTREIQPVSHFDEHALPAAPGPLTRRMQEAWQALRASRNVDP